MIGESIYLIGFREVEPLTSQIEQDEDYFAGSTFVSQIPSAPTGAHCFNRNDESLH